MKDSAEINRLALNLIDKQTTMTLATTHENIAWAAPIYYVYYHSTFFFFSDPTSRHIVEAIENQQAAAAIYAQVDTWQEIKGIQMSGRILQVKSNVQAIKAIRCYAKKFAFIKEFFKAGQQLNLEIFFKQFNARLYRLDPQIVYYLDNQIEFGFREEVELL